VHPSCFGLSRGIEGRLLINQTNRIQPRVYFADPIDARPRHFNRREFVIAERVEEFAGRQLMRLPHKICVLFVRARPGKVGPIALDLPDISGHNQEQSLIRELPR
jgi:hypothetical protein